MAISRRNAIKASLLSPLALKFTACSTKEMQQTEQPKEYYYHGRTPDYKPFQIIEKGLKIKKIETFTKNNIAMVKVTLENGSFGWGQISTYDSDITAMVLHRKVAHVFLDQDPSEIDLLVDRTIEQNYKYPWSYVCRALGGIETAIWDLYGRIKEKPVVELLGGEVGTVNAYGSSMSRQISPKEEADRMLKLRDEEGYKAFKMRAGSVNGHNKDASPGRTEELIKATRKALGDDVDLLIDGNSCYTPDKAIEVGKLLEQNNFIIFEEPCPYWELEWTADVNKALQINISGGEQDNDLAQFRRMIEMDAVDILQPDVLYIGGITRTIRVARMAEKKNKLVVPHSANHGLVTLFALHVLKAIPNAAPYLEYSIEYSEGINKEAEEMIGPRLNVVDGKVAISEEPGWGIHVNGDWLQSATYEISEMK